jgi:sugar lactone lactonase YvrE
MARFLARPVASMALMFVTGGAACLGTASPAQAATGSDPYADLYIVGQYDSSMLKIAAGGGETNVGSGLSDPYQVAHGPNRSLYVADAGNNRIVRIASDGTQTNAVTGLSYPNAVGVASDSTIYVGQGNQLLKVVSGVQTPITVSGGVTPYGIALDPSDNVFVSDYTRNRVIKVTAAGAVSVFATGIAFPTGIVADSDGNVFVTSATAYNVYRITPDGTKTVFATGIQYSWGLDIDGRGNLYASSNGSSSVYKMPPTFAGGNASALVTGLNSPIGLVVSSTPPPPTAVSGDAGDTKVTVSWTRSATYGGAPVTNYRVTSDPGNFTCTTSSASCEVTGLTNGQPYTFTVEAQNAVHNGWSPKSDASSAVTPAAPSAPAAPASLTVQPANGQLDLSFPPASSSGSAILRYEVSVDNGSWTTLPTTGTNPLAATVGGLANGTAYEVRVRAVNGIGDGAEVGPQSGTPRTVPGAPTLQAAQRGNASATLVVVPPQADGGSAVTGYEYSDDNAGTWHTLTTTAGTGGTRVGTVPSLSNGTPYTFLVRAVNAAGGGSPSTGQSVTPATTPGAPTLAAPTAGNGTLQLTVTPPGDNGGDTVTAYQVSTDNGATWATLTTTAGAGSTRVGTVSALTNGTTYQVRVRAVNGIGSGTASAAQAGTPSTVPGAIPGLTVEPGNTTAAVTFTPPATGGSAITGYEYSVNGTTWTTISTTAGTGSSRVATISGLINGTSYPVRLRALNAHGAGAGSEPVTVVPGTPQPPTGVTATAGTSSVTVSWTAPAGNGLPIDGYVATALPGPATCTAVAPATTCVLGGTAGTAYTVSVVAYAGELGSEASVASSAVTPTEPVAPTTPPSTALLLTTDKGDITRADPGEELVVFGEGFAPYSTVKVTVYSDPIVLGTVVTDSQGRFSLPVTVPTGLAAGAHSFIASGVDANGDPRAMKLVVTVAEGLAVTGAPALRLALTGAAGLFTGISLCALAYWLRRRESP